MNLPVNHANSRATDAKYPSSRETRRFSRDRARRARARSIERHRTRRGALENARASARRRA